MDFVCIYFIGDEAKKIELIDENGVKVTKIYTGNMTGLQDESYIHYEEDGPKYLVVKVCKEEGWFHVLGHEIPETKKIKWGLAKDDITPKDIFRLTNEGPKSRSLVAKYCIQDCNLVHHLFNKVDVITGLVEMSKLCSVPISFLIFRGQGIKLTSYVAKKCREKGVLMPVIDKGSRDDAYEGAIVLEPKCGLYLKEAVAVGDFASLYPSSMLSENLCPSTKVLTRIYDLAGNLISETGEKDKHGNFIYDNLPGIQYVDVQFDTYCYYKKNAKARPEKVLSGRKVCRFAQPVVKNGVEEMGIMPSILKELLKERKETRKKIPLATEEFRKQILEQRQLVIKGTANSLYGQLGAKTSTFYEPDIAASTTATGRLLLTFAKRVIEECYNNVDVETKKGIINTTAEYVYGDTDSVFFKFKLIDKETGNELVGKDSLEATIEIAQEACHNVSKVLKQPHDFEYEKTYHPLWLLAKKRYETIKFEFDPTKGKRNSMGTVSKRRDCAPIVKYINDGVLDIVMREGNLAKAIQFIDTCLQDLVDGKVPIEKLIISKSLRSFYKNPQSIAHKVLADRIAQRDPGNKPTSGDRIPFVYIVTKDKATKGKKILQGDRIETPTFVKENNLQIDYSFYITNQIMKPLLKLLGLILPDLYACQKSRKMGHIKKIKEEEQRITMEEEDVKKRNTKITKLRNKEVEELIFAKYLRNANNKKMGNRTMDMFYTNK